MRMRLRMRLSIKTRPKLPNSKKKWWYETRPIMTRCRIYQSIVPEQSPVFGRLYRGAHAHCVAQMQGAEKFATGATFWL